MASAPHEQGPGTYPGDDETPRERSVGEHVFIWIAWALAAIFWGATATIFTGILSDASQAVQAPSAPGVPGGMGYLALVVIAFVAVTLALAYASLRTAWTGRLERRSQADAAAPYDRADSRRGDSAAR